MLPCFCEEPHLQTARSFLPAPSRDLTRLIPTVRNAKPNENVSKGLQSPAKYFGKLMKAGMITQSVMSPCCNYSISVSISAKLISVTRLLRNTGVINTAWKKKTQQQLICHQTINSKKTVLSHSNIVIKG